MSTVAGDAESAQVKRLYQNHSVDSTRWSAYTPRDGDVIVASSYKSGTTWVQAIILGLFVPDLDHPPISLLSPWWESPLLPLETMTARFNAQPHRRVLKTHLPLDGLLFHPRVHYVVVGRDARDVCMSLWNQYRNAIRYPYLAASRHPTRIGAPLPPPPNDVGAFWRDWITRGWFPWETEGYPFWSNLRHTRTWWECAHLKNVMFVHFNDLLTDLRGQMERLAAFVQADVSAPLLDGIARKVTFAAMKSHADTLLPAAGTMLRGGAQSFFFRGTNGRWREALTAHDLQLYDAAVALELSPECARWLEHGRDYPR